MTLVYDPLTPVILQGDMWSCLAKSLRWSLTSYGIAVPEGYMEKQIRGAITNRGGYLNDKTGHDLADFMTEEFGTEGLTAEYTPSVTWDDVRADAGRFAMVIGGTNLHHYAAVRGYDPRYQVLLLANSAPRWKHLGHKMTKQEFDYYGPLARIRVATPHMIAEGGHRVVRPAWPRGLYRAAIVGASTLYLPPLARGGPDSGTGEGVVEGSDRLSTDGRRGRRVLRELLGRRTA